MFTTTTSQQPPLPSQTTTNPTPIHSMTSICRVEMSDPHITNLIAASPSFGTAASAAAVVTAAVIPPTAPVMVIATATLRAATIDVAVIYLHHKISLGALSTAVWAV
ncbi:hypothetical protein ElyMa_003415200 [Elysia marginata]|uniref:G-protein coupled receptors family 1 profile domain-containing protein n=1 Tax=Elysia marginata TaxID=1093978 RepID=A0AAV4JNQ6_9GAST|nr:hypothetical protein ElyMa_003415200 [Elysia marginata]